MGSAGGGAESREEVAISSNSGSKDVTPLGAIQIENVMSRALLSKDEDRSAPPLHSCHWNSPVVVAGLSMRLFREGKGREKDKD